MEENRRTLEEWVECFVCGWQGQLRAATYEKKIDDTIVIHIYKCQSCESDLYSYTEDKGDEKEYGGILSSLATDSSNTPEGV